MVDIKIEGEPHLPPNRDGLSYVVFEPQSGDRVQPQAAKPDPSDPDVSRWEDEGGHSGLGARPFRRVGYIRLDRLSAPAQAGDKIPATESNAT